MNDIFDKLEKNILENKNKAKEKKYQTDKLYVTLNVFDRVLN